MADEMIKRPDTLAERIEYARERLPRKMNGELPALRELEEIHGLGNGTFSKCKTEGRHNQSWQTAAKMARALGGVTVSWLFEDEIKCYGDVPGWAEAEAIVWEHPQRHGVTRGALLAAAEFEVLWVHAAVERMTVPIVALAATIAWDWLRSDFVSQSHYSTLAAERAANPGRDVVVPIRPNSREGGGGGQEACQ